MSLKYQLLQGRNAAWLRYWTRARKNWMDYCLRETRHCWKWKGCRRLWKTQGWGKGKNTPKCVKITKRCWGSCMKDYVFLRKSVRKANQFSWRVSCLSRTNYRNWRVRTRYYVRKTWSSSKVSTSTQGPRSSASWRNMRPGTTHCWNCWLRRKDSLNNNRADTSSSSMTARQSWRTWLDCWRKKRRPLLST